MREHGSILRPPVDAPWRSRSGPRGNFSRALLGGARERPRGPPPCRSPVPEPFLQERCPLRTGSGPAAFSAAAPTAASAATACGASPASTGRTLTSSAPAGAASPASPTTSSAAAWRPAPVARSARSTSCRSSPGERARAARGRRPRGLRATRGQFEWHGMWPPDPLAKPSAARHTSPSSHRSSALRLPLDAAATAWSTCAAARAPCARRPSRSSSSEFGAGPLAND